MMAGGGNGRTFVLALVGAGLAASAARFAWGSATDGLWFLGFAAVGLFAVGLPLVIAEGALGQFRRRNAVDAYGPGAWRGLGFVVAAGAVLLAALLAVLAGWSARFLVLSFSESWYDDPGRHFRLLASGPDAVLTTLGVLVAATGIALRGTRAGSKALVGFCAVVGLLFLAGLAVWANTLDGSDEGRARLFMSDADGVGWSLAFTAILAGLLPSLLATGATATLAAHLQERNLPREVTTAGLFVGVGVFLGALFVAGLAASQGLTLAQDGGLAAFTQLPGLFASVGGWQGGMAAGFFFGALLLFALVGLLVLLEVPATWLNERFGSWTEGRAFLAAGLVTLLVALPFCFGADAVLHFGQALAWVLTPIAGLLVSVHVGWARPEVLEGFRVGDARHPLAKFLRPLLRYVHPPILTLLLIAGTLGFLRAVGWSDGTDGLWALAP